MKNELAINKRQGQNVECTCRECHRITKHEITTEATLSGASGHHDFEIYWATEYQVVQCLGCETLSFRRTNSNSEDSPILVGPDEWEENIYEELFPSPHKGRQSVSDADLLPDKIQRIYEETLGALNNQHGVLCGIGVRAIVETVCKDKSATGHDLYTKINSLIGLGVLTQDGADILHKLRSLGNTAAHEVRPHTPKELSLAFDVVDHLLLGVYILPEHAKRTFK